MYIICNSETWKDHRKYLRNIRCFDTHEEAVEYLEEINLLYPGCTYYLFKACTVITSNGSTWEEI